VPTITTTGEPMRDVRASGEIAVLVFGTFALPIVAGFLTVWARRAFQPSDRPRIFVESTG